METEHINNLFNKRFTIVNNGYYVMPQPTAMFKDCQWTVPELQQMKNELNTVKDRLSNYDPDKWHLHTKSKNNAKYVMIRLKNNIQPEFLTQAWCKFYEIVSSFHLIPVNYIYNTTKCFKSIHLCEAPGAFITSLNHWLKTNNPNIKWDWYAMTLNPYYEGNPTSMMVDDDRFIRHTLSHWYFGEDNTGNVMNLKNLDGLIKLLEPHNDIFLITADGSIDCADVPAEQESTLIHLHFCEIVAALQLLSTEGSFVLKIFTIFECNSICLIYILSCCFNNVSVIKPVTSKEGNSETYVVCTNFKGPAFISPYLEKLRDHYENGPKQAIFSKHDIPCEFINTILECAEFFKSKQLLVIMDNISTFHYIDPKISRNMNRMQWLVADKYVRDYNVKKLKSGEILGNKIISGKSVVLKHCKRSLQGSYNERCKKQHSAPLDQIRSLSNDFNKIEIQVSSGTVLNFKFSEFPEDLQIRSGKVFHKICNSKFCNKNALRIQNDINDAVDTLNCKIEFPSIQSIEYLKDKLCGKPKHEVLIFRYTDIYDSHKIITEIYNTLQHLDIGTTLVLIGYPLLTHLTIELLYLMSCAFNSLEVKVCDNVGLKVKLYHYNYNHKVLYFLNKIKAASSEAYKQEKAILGIISPSLLYEGCHLCYSADLNNWIIKTYIHYVLYILNIKL